MLSSKNPDIDEGNPDIDAMPPALQNPPMHISPAATLHWSVVVHAAPWVPGVREGRHDIGTPVAGAPVGSWHVRVTAPRYGTVQSAFDVQCAKNPLGITHTEPARA